MKNLDFEWLTDEFMLYCPIHKKWLSFIKTATFGSIFNLA